MLRSTALFKRIMQTRIVLLAVLLASTVAKASNSEVAEMKVSEAKPRNTVTLDLLPSIGYGLRGDIAVSVEAERAFWSRFSLFVGVFALPNARVVAELRLHAVQLEVGARFFPASSAPKGFFVSGGVGAGVGFLRTYETRATVVGVDEHVDFQLGYTWILWDRFVISLGAGAILTSNYGRSIEPKEYSSSGLAPSLRVALGYAF